MRVILLCVAGAVLVAISGGSSPALAADRVAEPDDQLWKLAGESYAAAGFETGHSHLKTLLDNNPGDIGLALQCLRKILHEADRQQRHTRLQKIDNHWAVYAAARYCALQRLDEVSAQTAAFHDALEITVGQSVRQGRLVEAVEMIDHFASKNSFDPFWRITQAQFYRKLDSSKTRELYDKLRAAIDLDHPDAEARQQWVDFSLTLETDIEALPQAILPLPKGSLLSLMEPDDPDGEWARVANRAVRQIAPVVDRLAARALVEGEIVPWRDKSGLIDPARALDLHLLSRPAADLEPLRKLQAERTSHEVVASDASEAEILRLYRRFPWALKAQQRLLSLGNRMLWAGRAQSALRSFGDLLDHAADSRLRDAAQVGYWTAQAQIGVAGELELLGEVDPNRSFTWLGKPTKASVICKQLLAGRTPRGTMTAPVLADLAEHVVRIPPVSPWPGDLPAEVDLAVAGSDLLVSGRDMLAMYNAREPNRPVWTNLQRQHAQRRRRKDRPGYFRPAIDGSVLYSRFGFSSVPRGMAAIDRTTGRPLWYKNQLSNSRGGRRIQVPLCDPVLADGHLHYLQWSAVAHISHTRSRRLSVVCLDPRRRRYVWDGTIAIASTMTDSTWSLERAHLETAIFGNRVTIHEGAIYSSSNSGILARSDLRDGRTEWIHTYRPQNKNPNIRNHGSPPVIAGDKVIFMPRDSRQLLALDQRNGRLVWENSLVLGVQIMGTHQDLLIVRGQTGVAGIDMATGDARWYRPMNRPVLGRGKLIGSSVYLAQLDHLLRLDAKTGLVEENRPWAMKGERPRNFVIKGRDLYVVTDRPADDPGQEIGRPLNRSAPNRAMPLALPLQRAWSLRRENAQLAIPPKDSPLRGTAYIISDGILECLEVSARGGIRWRRFIDTYAPSIHFAGKTMLVVNHTKGRVPGLANRVVAYDATDGRILWENVVPNNIQQTINCGSTQIFYTANRRISALNLTTGRWAWQRSLGHTHRLRIFGDAEHLQVFFVSSVHSVHHLRLDARSGQTLNDISFEALGTSGDVNNGRALRDGYYEVKIKPVRGRYVRLVALSEVSGRGWTSIAELQAIGEGGKNIPRDRWKVHHVDSFEAKSSVNEFPESAIDNDPITWWHTKWKGGVPRHPHEIQIDTGIQQTIAGIRYLPAKIVTNNGMILDYELYTSSDAKNWGTPLAKGLLVNRPRVERIYAADSAIVFEAHYHRTKTRIIYQYALDGKPAVMVERDARLAFAKGRYFGTIARKNKEDMLTVRRFDDASYRFELGSSKQFDIARLEIIGDRLVSARTRMLIADLAKKRFILGPTDNKLPQNKNGLVLLDGSDHLLKIIHRGQQGQAVLRFDLRTGQQTESTLVDQIKPFRDLDQRSPLGGIQHVDRVLLMNDNSAITAWIAGGKSKGD